MTLHQLLNLRVVKWNLEEYLWKILRNVEVLAWKNLELPWEYCPVLNRTSPEFVSDPTTEIIFWNKNIFKSACIVLNPVTAVDILQCPHITVCDGFSEYYQGSNWRHWLFPHRLLCQYRSRDFAHCAITELPVFMHPFFSFSMYTAIRPSWYRPLKHRSALVAYLFIYCFLDNNVNKSDYIVSNCRMTNKL